MKTKTLLTRVDLLPAQTAFAAAARYSREWNAEVKRAIALYGERPQGGHVSGIYSEHLPKAVQDRLSELARRVSFETEQGFEMRPSRVQMVTMRALKTAVRERDGSGFYG